MDSTWQSVRSSIIDSVIPRRKPNWLLVSALGIYAASIPMLSKQPGLTTISWIIGAAVAVLFLFTLVSNPRNRLWFPVQFIGFYVFLLLEMDFTRPEVFLTVLQLILLLLFVHNIIRRPEPLWVVSLLFGIGLYVVAFDVIQHNDPGAVNQVRGRIVSLVTNANEYALMLNLAILLCFYHFPAVKSFFLRLVLLASIALFASQGVIYAGSRKGFAGLILMAALYALIYLLFSGRRYRFRALLLFVLSLLFILSLIVFVPELTPMANRYLNVTVQSDYTAGGRLHMWDFVLNHWARYPLLGHGTNAFQSLYAIALNSHSNILELLFNHGLVGLISYYTFHLTMIILYIRYFRAKYISLRVFAWGMATLCQLLLFDLAGVTLYLKIVWVMYGILSGLLLLHRPDSSARAELSLVNRDRGSQ